MYVKLARFNLIVGIDAETPRHIISDISKNSLLYVSHYYRHTCLSTYIRPAGGPTGLRISL